MPKKYFAIAKKDNAFIVSAPTREALMSQIDSIRERHPEFYEKNIAAGYYVVEAENIKESKTSEVRALSFDLPLFSSASFDYQVMELIAGTQQTISVYSCNSLQEALKYISDKSPKFECIDVYDAAGEHVKRYEKDAINKILTEERLRHHGKQLKLF